VVVNAPEESYYQLARRYGRENLLRGRFAVPVGGVAETGGIVVRPLDKKEHYIKRTIGLPGETLEVANREVFIDGERIESPEGIQYTYEIFPGSPLSSEMMNARYGIQINEQAKLFYA